MTVQLHRNGNAFITHVDDTIEQLLGWTPEQLIGSPSTELIHPQDQASAVAAWMQMVDAPGTTRRFRGRYRSAGGAWVWVETENTNLLDDELLDTVGDEPTGVAFQAGRTSADDLIARADHTMYEAKRGQQSSPALAEH